MSEPLDKISAELLEAAMKAEFAESQISLAQRISSKIASSPYSNRHNNAAAEGVVEATTNNPPHSNKELLGHVLQQSVPMIISRHEQSTKPPTLSIDPLTILPTTTPAPAPHAVEPMQPQNHLNAPHYTGVPLAIDTDAPVNPTAAGIGTTTQPQRGRRGTRNAAASGSGRNTQARPISDFKTRAEATKEKNRRAQQRFRHKQKSRLEWLECEVTRLRNLLTEKGIDPGIGEMEDAVPADAAAATTTTTTAGAAVSPLPSEHFSVDHMYSELESWLEECTEYIKHTTAVRYLQAWLAMGEDARRLHYTAIQKRYSAAKYSDVAVWVEMQTHGSSGGNSGAENTGNGGGAPPCV